MPRAVRDEKEPAVEGDRKSLASRGNSTCEGQRLGQTWSVSGMEKGAQCGWREVRGIVEDEAE